MALEERISRPQEIARQRRRRVSGRGPGQPRSRCRHPASALHPEKEIEPKALALVGKGICFDTGGTNLKTARAHAGMHEDMEGSAVALGTLLALTELKGRSSGGLLAGARPEPYRPQGLQTKRYRHGRERHDHRGGAHRRRRPRMVLADTLHFASQRTAAADRRLCDPDRRLRGCAQHAPERHARQSYRIHSGPDRGRLGERGSASQPFLARARFRRRSRATSPTSNNAPWKGTPITSWRRCFYASSYPQHAVGAYRSLGRQPQRAGSAYIPPPSPASGYGSRSICFSINSCRARP